MEACRSRIWISLPDGCQIEPVEILSGNHAMYERAMEACNQAIFQSIAGAVSTATHGTGLRYGSVSSLVVELELITAAGEVLRCSHDQNPDVFAAARCGLGALGLISTVTLQCEPAFCLKSVERRANDSHGASPTASDDDWPGPGANVISGSSPAAAAMPSATADQAAASSPVPSPSTQTTRSP